MLLMGTAVPASGPKLPQASPILDWPPITLYQMSGAIKVTTAEGSENAGSASTSACRPSEHRSVASIRNEWESHIVWLAKTIARYLDRVSSSITAC